MSGILNALVGSAAPKFVQVNPATYSDSQVIPGTAEIQLRFNSNGNLETAALPSGFTTQYAWLLIGANSDYELRVTTTSGSFTSGTTGSWLALSTSRTYTKQNSSIGSVDVVATYEIRRVSDSVVIASASITLRATGL